LNELHKKIWILFVVKSAGNQNQAYRSVMNTQLPKEQPSKSEFCLKKAYVCIVLLTGQNTQA